ncbi:MAG: phosphopyruvate hydratase [Bryobacteraceae bacterium]|nr:phosphopyruvate hydratase [Bryobacteraceae bacterium]
MKIQAIHGWEILDSRGRPTVAALCELSDGTRAQAHAPSGASTGKHEAHELRDGDPLWYAGKGVGRAVAHVNGELRQAVLGLDAQDQARVDRALCEADGTPNKSRLGANALLAISCAVARACAASLRVPLWQYLRGQRAAAMPLPMVNILSGGLHAGGNIEFQDFLVMPHGVAGYRQQLEAIVRVHATAKQVLDERGLVTTGVADEGGWGPRFRSNEQALEVLTEAIGRTGLPMSIALDVASSHFYRDGEYHLATEGRVLSAAGMADLLADWSERYPIRSVEDALEEDDWAGWRTLTAQLGGKLQLVGDDFFTTNPERVARGIREGCANSVLVKMNQIGTLTETFAVIDQARAAGYGAVISARSGETEDSFLADLAVASGAGQIKIGSITRSERLAKYNRLLEIEADFA